MSRTRIKLCGFTRVEDALHAAHAGADAIGLIFYPASPRVVSADRAREIRVALPPFISTVGLFVNETPQTVASVIEKVRPSILQFHGDENEAYCSQFGLPYMKAIRVGAETKPDDLLECQAAFHSAQALLLDTLSPTVYGGSGTTFDWSVIPMAMRERVVLSGGLDPADVGSAVQQIRPWAVDVSSGVETAQKGIKDHHKIEQFIEAVRNADAR